MSLITKLKQYFCNHEWKKTELTLGSEMPSELGKILLPHTKFEYLRCYKCLKWHMEGARQL